MRVSCLIATLLILATPLHAQDAERDAASIVRDAVNHWRGLSSYTEMSMVIHRPDWERSMTMRAKSTRPAFRVRATSATIPIPQMIGEGEIARPVELWL